MRNNYSKGVWDVRMTSEEKFYQYIMEHYSLNDGEARIARNIIKFIWSRTNWGIGYQSHSILEMLDGIGLTEAEILHFLQDKEGKPDKHKEF